MPIYSYKCLKCNAEFDFLHLTKEDIAICPNTDKNKEDSNEHEIQNILGLTSFQLKGSGWAKDNYAKPNK